MNVLKPLLCAPHLSLSSCISTFRMWKCSQRTNQLGTHRINNIVQWVVGKRSIIFFLMQYRSNIGSRTTERYDGLFFWSWCQWCTRYKWWWRRGAAGTTAATGNRCKAFHVGWTFRWLTRVTIVNWPTSTNTATTRRLRLLKRSATNKSLIAALIIPFPYQPFHQLLFHLQCRLFHTWFGAGYTRIAVLTDRTGGITSIDAELIALGGGLPVGATGEGGDHECGFFIIAAALVIVSVWGWPRRW